MRTFLLCGVALMLLSAPALAAKQQHVRAPMRADHCDSNVIDQCTERCTTRIMKPSKGRQDPQACIHRCYFGC